MIGKQKNQWKRYEFSHLVRDQKRGLFIALYDTSVRSEGRAISVNFPYTPSTLWDCLRKSVDPASGQSLQLKQNETMSFSMWKLKMRWWILEDHRMLRNEKDEVSFSWAVICENTKGLKFSK